VVRSTIPAVTHVDYSARVQTVDEGRNPRFYRLMRAFRDLTGCPVIVNTSFNVRGEPIVCTPEDAYRCFLATEMDALVLEDTVVHKTEASRAAVDLAGRQKYLAQFQLD
jgi:carbamoyltransferase